MTLRRGLTADEEKKLQRLIQKGASWEKIVEHQRDPDEVPHFVDVDLEYVRVHLFEPMVKTHELKKKFGNPVKKLVEAGKKWEDIEKELPKDLPKEDAEHIRKFIYAPTRQVHVVAEKARKAAEADTA
jgi:hypothetical protein